MTQQTPDFESIKHIDPYGEEQWSARELQPLLGYNRWENFYDAIKRAMISCETSGNDVERCFRGVTKTSSMPNGGTKRLKDYNLNRLACYLIAQNGDPRKQEIATAQLYFAIATRQNEIAQLRQAQEERLSKRLKVSDSYKSLASAADTAGVESGHMGIFMDAGNLGLYRKTLEELKREKGVPEKEEYLDRIGSRELSAIDFKNELTKGKIQDDQIAEEDKAIDTHYYMGDLVRDTIKRAQQPLPETLPTEPSIRKLVEERRRKAKRRKLPSPDEQEKLF